MICHKRLYEEISTSSGYIPSSKPPISSVDEKIASLSKVLKRKFEKRARGELVVLSTDLKSFVLLNPSQQALDNLVKTAASQNIDLLENILSSLLQKNADLESVPIPCACDILHKLLYIYQGEKALATIFSHALRNNYSAEIQLEILDKILSHDVSTSTSLSILKESISFLRRYTHLKQPMERLIDRFLNKNPSISQIIKLFDCLKYGLTISIPGQDPSFLYPDIVERLLAIIRTTKLLDKDAIYLLRDAAKTGHKELALLFFRDLMRKPRDIRFFHKLQEYPEIYSSPSTLGVTNKTLLHSSFSIYADNPMLAEYDFDLLLKESPPLFHLFVAWITASEKGLVHAAHFLDEESRPSFVSSVLSILKFAQENTAFRPIVYEELTDALSSCADRATLSVNNLLLQMRLFTFPQMSLPNVLKICKAKIATDVLKEFSARLGEEKKEDGDPIEIQLHLESFFRHEFGLIGAIEEQRFDANITASDIVKARAAVQKVLNNPKRLSSLLIAPDEHQKDSLWVKKLKQDPLIQQQHQALEDLSYKLLETLDDSLNNEETEKVLAQFPRQDCILFRKLIEKYQFQGTHMAKYAALHELKFHREQRLFREKTLAILGLCSRETS